MRFYEVDNKGGFEDIGHDIYLDLNEQNFNGVLHETMDENLNVHTNDYSLYDMIQVRGDDGYSHTEWRFDRGNEEFSKLEYLLRRYGAFIVRQTVLDVVRETFETTHPFTDKDFEELHP